MEQTPTNQQQEQTSNDSVNAEDEVVNTIEHFKGLYENEKKAREKAESQVVALSKLLRVQPTQEEPKEPQKKSSEQIINDLF